jgi:hypothetical protein
MRQIAVFPDLCVLADDDAACMPNMQARSNLREKIVPVFDGVRAADRVQR